MSLDIRLSVDVLDSPKIVKLIRRLEADGFYSLLRLWCWTRCNRPDGILTGMDAEAVEIAARWNGPVGRFIEELTNLQLLDTDKAGVYEIHEWMIHQPFMKELEMRVKRAKAAAAKRWENAEEVQVHCSSNAQAMLKQCSSNASDMLVPCPKRSEAKRNEPDEEKKRPGPADAAGTRTPAPVKVHPLEITESYLTELQAMPCYRGLDVRKLNSKMHTWCTVNNKRPSKKRLVNWLNREEPARGKPAGSVALVYSNDLEEEARLAESDRKVADRYGVKVG